MSEPTRVVRSDEQAAAPVAAPAPTPSAGPIAPMPLSAMVVGAAGDQAEVDADRVADAALARLAPLGAAHRHGSACAQRVSRLPSTATGAVVGAAGGELDGVTAAAIESRRGAGDALPAGVRRRMEGAFGGSFSAVRIHDDHAAAALSRSVSARAFTIGSDIFFDRGEFAPDTAAGERVLAHELAHTRQPAGGARRLTRIRRLMDPDEAHEFADVLDQILSTPQEAHRLAVEHQTLLAARWADPAFVSRLDPAMRTLLDGLAQASTHEEAELTTMVEDYRLGHDIKVWTHVAGASFSPQRQRIKAMDDALFEDEDAEKEFKDGTDRGLSDLDSLIRFATIEIDKANGKHQAEMADLSGPDQADTVMVFLGPEWMFANRMTPVSPAERDSTIEKFRKLSVLYPQMVLVPGTIRSGKPREAKRKKGLWKDIRNTVFVVWNGKVVHTHDKAGDVGDTNVLAQHPDKDPVKRYGGDRAEMAKDPIFELGNLTFAIDICGDHFDRRAQNAVGTDRDVNVHLVTAAGTTPKRDRSATGPNGLMLGSDVDGAGPSFLPPGEEQSMELSNLPKGAKPKVASTTVVGGVVPPPQPETGSQILTGHRADKGQSKFHVLTYYARREV